MTHLSLRNTALFNHSLNLLTYILNIYLRYSSHVICQCHNPIRTYVFTSVSKNNQRDDPAYYPAPQLGHPHFYSVAGRQHIYNDFI